MTTFATVDDVAALLRRTLSIEEVRAADLMLATASAAIRGWTRQTITAVADDVAHLEGTWSHRLILPERPVTAVTAVMVGVTALVAGVDYAWTGRDVVLRGPALAAGQTGDLGRCGDWGGPDASITVTYSHGYAPGDARLDAARGVCLDLIERRLVRPTGVSAENIGRYRVVYDKTEPSGMVLLPGDEARLKRYRRSVT